MQNKNPIITTHNYDLVIIGAGGAGLMTAITAKKSGLRNVAVISKIHPLKSHTGAAKGGINAALGNITEDDWRWHLHDTLAGGDGLADADACEILCKNAKDAILDLAKIGVDFSLTDDGKISQRKYGGQRLNSGKGELAYRACYSKDETGKTILESLYREAKSLNVIFYDEFFTYDLIANNENVAGCIAIDLCNGELVKFKATNTVIATGGYSQIFHTTTSAKICSGDGTALAFMNNMQLQDMEFIQFHPSGIAGQGFLITEAARAEGGYLLNSQGDRFMKKYDPQMAELACRDVISRAIANEILEGRGVGPHKNGVYLDLRHLKGEIFTKKIPGVVDIAKNFANIDVTKDCLIIAPSAHYNMGGIPTDLNCQVVNQGRVVSGLYAVGEAACLSVHGANRLGCNSLLELVVFGKICGENIAKNLSATDFEDFDSVAEEKVNKFNQELIYHNSQIAQESIAEVIDALKIINEKYLAIFRTEEKMRIGIQELEKIRLRIKGLKVHSRDLAYNNELTDLLELKNLYINSLASFHSAINRKESRGSHFHNDYPGQGQEPLHSLISLQNEDMKLEYKKVS